MLSRFLYSNAISSGLFAWAKTSGAAVFEQGAEAKANRSGGVLVSEMSDYENFQTLRNNENLKLLLPVREDSPTEDVAKNLQFLGSSIDPARSTIRTNHKQQVQREFRMTSSTQRWQAIEEIGKYIKTQPVFEALAEIGKTVASELLTNAFYNAPQDSLGRSLTPNRNEESSITPPSEVVFSFGDDGEHIWLSVKDPFGTFDRNKLLDHLSRCSKHNMMTVRTGVGGAGIGLYMVYRWSSQLLFEFSPGRMTTVMVKLLKTKRVRVFESQRTIFEVVQLFGDERTGSKAA